MIINKDKILNISKFHKKNWKLGGKVQIWEARAKEFFLKIFLKPS